MAVVQRVHVAREEAQMPPVVRAVRRSRPMEAAVAHVVQHCGGIVVPIARRREKDSFSLA
ncbi:hypothetical protein [Bacteroides heparinolyticus]|uniref:hypothetical protein n=1 Tax=Prevotella heparinolytica TaxID=28113 RepID=UPI0035A10312